MKRIVRTYLPFLMLVLATFTFLQVWAQVQTKPFPSDAELLQLVEKHIHTTVYKVPQPDGELFLQRDFGAYLHVMPTYEGHALQAGEKDFGHDHNSILLEQFLSRPHPSVATLEKYFLAAATEMGVPVQILQAYALVQSNWAQVSESQYGSWGIMGLIENNMSRQISEGAALLNVSKDEVKNNAKTNIRAGAALLLNHQKRKGSPVTIEDWFESVCELTGLRERYLQESLAQRVFKVIREGSKTVSIWGEIIFLPPDATVPLPIPRLKNNNEGEVEPAGNGTPDYPGAILDYTSCNYNSRPQGAIIKYYFVHYIATGTYEGTISWFKNCNAAASAHYVVRNFDGQVTQMVDEANRAWTQGVTEYNDQGIGVEHEVLATNLLMWDNVNMQREAGKLAADVCNRNGIPKQRRTNNGEWGIYGHSDVRATDCPNLTQQRWDNFFLNVPGALPSVGSPVMHSIQSTPGSSEVTATWRANTEPALVGYRLYYATDDALTQWAMAADEAMLPAGTTTVTLQPAQFKKPPNGPIYHFRMTAVVPNGSEPVVESGASDAYSRSWMTSGPKVLIVDGFDRISGSYKNISHPFAASYFKAIRDRGLVQVSTVANEKVEDGTFNLTDYNIVIWFVGDESSVDVVLSASEKTQIANFLNGGGKLMVSGSEISYNIGRTGATNYDLAFMNNYLKANYVNDGNASYTPATGITGTPFEGLNIPFGIVYPEDFPDAISPVGEAISIMNYALAPNIGGIAYKGTFGSGQSQGALIYLGFTLETASDISMSAFMQKALPYFGVDPMPSAPITFADSARVRRGISKRVHALNNDLGNGSSLNKASILISTQPINGTATPQPDGSILYTSLPNFSGTDMFSYKVASTQGLYSNASTVTLHVTDADACDPDKPEVDDHYPVRDLRGAWIGSVFNLDWPTNRLAAPATQQAELLRILDTLKNTGFNTVFLQVRTGSDALYQSPFEPWSYYLTGTEGQAPTPLWDPLQFAVNAAHERGMELHAWLNPYRARTGSYTLAANHVMNQKPDWILNISGNYILNPGLPDVMAYIVKISSDIASRYRVDGIHFDDYFYPSGITAGMQDAATFTNFNPTNIATIEDWRRDNVNRMIGRVYDTIQHINTATGRNIIFGVSPFGIWKSGTPQGIVGQSSYSALYCDPIAWLQAGTVDYLAPQLYWKITGAQDYNILSQWWNDRGKQYGRPIYTGHAWYKMVDANNWPASEIEEQIKLNRLPVRNEIKGEIGYRTLQIMANSKGLKTALQQGQYRYPTYVPPYPWKDTECPNPPDRVRLEGDTLRWEKPLPAADGDTAVKYVVYAYENAEQAKQLPYDGTKVKAITAQTKLFITNAGYTRYVVSALDKNNNESLTTISDIPEALLCPGGSTNLPAMVTGNSYQWQVLNGLVWEPLQPNAHFAGTQTAELTISNLPLNYYGTQLRCVADGNKFGGEYIIRFGSLWTAATNEKWNVATNWSCGTVPTIETDAIIHGGVTPFPVVESPGAEARRVLLRTGAQVQVLPGMSLRVGQQ